MHQLPSFDELRELAEKDPDALEALRKSLSMEYINTAPSDHQPRLRGLLFRIDMERRRAKTPLQACIRLSSMMQDSFLALNDALNSFNETPDESSSASYKAVKSARILSFKSPPGQQRH